MAAKQCYQSKQLLYRSKWNSKNFITIENGGSIRRKHRPEKDPEQMSLRTFPFEKNLDRGMDKDMVHIYSGGEGNSNTHQYSCVENSMDRGAWQSTVHGVAKSWTQLSN